MQPPAVMKIGSLEVKKKKKSHLSLFGYNFIEHHGKKPRVVILID